MRTARPRLSCFETVVYVACTVLVLSFLLFEVLDIDGSNVPPTATGPALTTESDLSTDLKRCPPDGAPPVVATVGDLPASRMARIIQRHGAHHQAPRLLAVTLNHGYRVPLARAILPAPSPAA